MYNLKTSSSNCQGLSDSRKRRDVLQFLRQKDFNIYFLSDTHFKPSLEKQIRAEWGYECCFSSNTSQSRGVAILFNKNFDFKIIQTIKDKDGNFLIVKIETMNKEFILVNVYGPNRDDPEFYKTIESRLSNFTDAQIIIAGDFNLVLDPDLDYSNYKHINNQTAQRTVHNMNNSLNLVDIWREINPDIQRFTWRRKNTDQQARLDFFLISENLLSFVQDADILYGYRSDHSLITINLCFSKETKPRGM